MSYRIVVRAAWLVAIVSAPACSSSTELGGSSVVGAYGLHSVNGSSLPYLDLEADTLFLQSDGSVRRFFRKNQTGTVYPTEGTYSVAGAAITFTDYSSEVTHPSGDATGPASGSLQGSEIVLNRDGDILVYEKKP